jgi:hypothetical protein
MPRISAFYGIVIAIYFSDHPPPHFHAKYGEWEASVEIETGAVLAGALPPSARRLVAEWAALHRDELTANWDKARLRQGLDSITPLA